MNNQQIVQLLRNVAAVYQITGENHFKIVAYERAADSIEHLTSEAKDYWDDGKVYEIPGVGKTIAGHLDELFKTGHAKHIEATFAKVPKSIFPLLLVSGIGPKRAYALVTTLKLSNDKKVIEDLLAAAKDHKVAQMEHFGEKSEQELIQNIELYKKGSIKENRISIWDADMIAGDIKEFLLKNTHITRVDILGSLRRRVATIGDIDLSILTSDVEGSIDHFCTYKHEKIIERGPTGASLLLTSGRQVDMRVCDADSYGAMLQYFTGSKNHNIKLREYAIKKGVSLSEYGIKMVDKAKYTITSKTHANIVAQLKKAKEQIIIPMTSEDEFYGALGLPLIPPELREDKGEIEAARSGSLPFLIKPEDIRGDIHMHTDYNLEPSHDLGGSTIEEMLDTAVQLGYEYIGISDHNPSVGNHTPKEICTILKRRKEYYEHHYDSWLNDKKSLSTKKVQLYTFLEIDILPSGELAIPNEAFEYLDGAIVSVHSSFRLEKSEMTKRIIRALTSHEKVRVLGHPTGRLLGKREGIDADWKEIFALCLEKNIALEINANPARLDLSDALVYEAIGMHVPLIINTDAHHKNDLSFMSYGVDVARRGWAKKDDIVNCLPYNKFNSWIQNKT